MIIVFAIVLVVHGSIHLLGGAVRGYRSCGVARLAARGEARWHEPGGEYAYIELTIDDVGYNVPDGENADAD